MGTKTPIYDQVMAEVLRHRDEYFLHHHLARYKDPSTVFEIYINEKTHYNIMEEIYSTGGVSPFGIRVLP